MVSEEATECSPRELGGCTSCLRGESPTCSFEEVITLSDSLSLSSYSSWLLLPPPARWLTPVWKRPPRSRLFLLYKFESCWTVRPVVTISSVAEDREDEDGLELRSIQDSSECCLDSDDVGCEGAMFGFRVYVFSDAGCRAGRCGW